ncbi:MAG TPA: HAMP domain-containing sensor histidine kinase [Gaiellaceae bacterium]|jgi:signal transduction histidine kinase
MSSPTWLSLRVKVGLILFAVVAGALAIVYVAVIPQLESRLVDAKVGELSDVARTIQPRVARPGTSIELQNDVRNASEVFNTRVVVFAPFTQDSLQNLADSNVFRANELLEDTVALEVASTGRPSGDRVSREDAEFAEAARPLPNGRILLVSSPLGDALDNVRLIRRSLLVAGAVALAISWFAGYLLAWNFTRRIARLETAAERVAGGDFETPIVDTGRDEVSQLAKAFDDMRARLAALDRARREFIANASHELRTPLFSLGGFVELLGDETMDPVVRRDFLGEMRDQIDRLTRLATDLLDLSRLDAGQLEVETVRFDLAATARAVAEEFRAVAETEEHELATDADEPVEVLADEVRVQQIARVFVENAIRHTPRGTTVGVRAGTTRDGAVLAVTDDGPGIPDEDRPHLFQRFYRAGGGKASGSGLGLAIASELATRMAGRIDVRSRAGETVFTLVLPLAAAPSPGEAPEEPVASPAGRGDS